MYINQTCSPGNKDHKNPHLLKKMWAKWFLQILSPLGPANYQKMSTAKTRGFGLFYPPWTPFFHVFLPEWCAANTKITKTHYIMNHSVRRHLNEHKKYFLKFFRVSGLYLRGSWNGEKMWIFAFLPNFGCFWIFQPI